MRMKKTATTTAINGGNCHKDFQAEMQKVKMRCSSSSGNVVLRVLLFYTLFYPIPFDSVVFVCVIRFVFPFYDNNNFCGNINFKLIFIAFFLCVSCVFFRFRSCCRYTQRWKRRAMTFFYTAREKEWERKKRARAHSAFTHWIWRVCVRFGLAFSCMIFHSGIMCLVYNDFVCVFSHSRCLFFSSSCLFFLLFLPFNGKHCVCLCWRCLLAFYFFSHVVVSNSQFGSLQWIFVNIVNVSASVVFCLLLFRSFLSIAIVRVL